MKKIIRGIVDAAIVPAVGHILHKINLESRSILRHSVVEESVRRAVSDSADYVDSHMEQALCFPTKGELRRHAFNARTTGGLILEFGVWRGTSINFFALLTKETIYGFDSFEGLREDWQGSGLPKGTFDLKGALPTVPDNVKLIKGWFHQTLPSFLWITQSRFRLFILTLILTTPPV